MVVNDKLFRLVSVVFSIITGIVFTIIIIATISDGIGEFNRKNYNFTGGIGEGALVCLKDNYLKEMSRANYANIKSYISVGKCFLAKRSLPGVFTETDSGNYYFEDFEQETSFYIFNEIAQINYLYENPFGDDARIIATCSNSLPFCINAMSILQTGRDVTGEKVKLKKNGQFCDSHHWCKSVYCSENNMCVEY